MYSHLDHEALAGATAFVLGSLVFIVEVDKKGRALGVGSGAVFLTPRGHPVILSARHVLQARGVSIAMGFPGCPGEALRDCVLGLKLSDDSDVDVGLMIPKRAAREAIRGCACPLSSVAYAEDSEPSDGRACIIGGYPWVELCLEPDQSRTTMHQNFGSITHACEFHSVDEKGRHWFLWDSDVVSQVHDASGAHQLGAVEKLPDPKGMSGGPLWRFDRPAADAIWLPSRLAKLIGVQSAVSAEGDRIIVEPASRWRKWLDIAVRDVDEYLASEGD